MTHAPRTNLIADPHALPLADGSVDAVIIDAVLEHMIDPARVADEIFRALTTDGLVYADSPFMVPVHGGTHDFLRFSPVGEPVRRRCGMRGGSRVRGRLCHRGRSSADLT